MISANINNKLRKAIYARDNYACALCDDSRRLQIHHVIHRSQGGANQEQNLITLCPVCHAAAHGNIGYDDPIRTQAICNQAIVEYLADYYAPDWNPYRKGQHPLEQDRRDGGC